MNSIVFPADSFQGDLHSVNIFTVDEWYRAGGKWSWIIIQTCHIAMQLFLWVVMYVALTFDYYGFFDTGQFAWYAVIAGERSILWEAYTCINLVIGAAFCVATAARAIINYILLPEAIITAPKQAYSSWNAMLGHLGLLQHRTTMIDAVRRMQPLSRYTRLTPLRVYVASLPMFTHSPSWSHVTKRCRIAAVVATVALPIGIPAAAVYIGIRSSHRMYDGRTVSLGDWSPAFKLSQYHVNESPADTNRRLKVAAGVMDRYLQHRISKGTIATLEFITALCATTCLALVCVGAIHEDVLTHTHLFGRNLVWYIAALTATTALCQACLPNTRQQAPLPEDVMIHIHTDSRSTWPTVLASYGFVPMFMAYNMWSLITLPYFLWVTMPRFLATRGNHATVPWTPNQCSTSLTPLTDIA